MPRNRERTLPVADPALEIAPVHDAEDQDHPVLVDDVVHHAVIAHAEPEELVAHAVDRLDGLAADPVRLRRVRREPLQRLSDALLKVGRQLLVGPNGRRGQRDAVGAQWRSSKLVVRPFA